MGRQYACCLGIHRRLRGHRDARKIRRTARSTSPMNTLLHWLADYGLVVAFVNVLVGQLGAPVPSYPILIVTGALSMQGRYSTAALFAIAILACLVADLSWYAGGRRYGGRVVRSVCRISISPDSCVRRTESLFARHGARSLVVAKFIPGFGAIATALSGNGRVPLGTFLFYDTIGAALYTGLAIGLGMLFRNAVGDVLDVLVELGRLGLVVILAAFALFVGVKWWQRHRLIKELRMARITVPELLRLLDEGTAPTIIDVRAHPERMRDGTIPGAVAWPAEGDDDSALDLPKDSEVIVYCACPNEVSAARVAKRLHLEGFKRVRPLHGGIEAWIDAGQPVEHEQATAEV
jgi:membrane protein DedA with SNARE-associated domain/rhodanese-related sulfurtransferase